MTVVVNGALSELPTAAAQDTDQVGMMLTDKK